MSVKLLWCVTPPSAYEMFKLEPIGIVAPENEADDCSSLFPHGKQRMR